MDKKWQERCKEEMQKPDDVRTPFDIDYARIIHSSSFRRLQGKTQTLNLGDSDFYRTRLTHSLEVAQIANGIRANLVAQNAKHDAYPYLPSTSLIQAIGLAHDLGHPPFGHGGEIALNYCMRGKNGGFEGNGQTLRILSKLENFSEKHGANLTRRTLLGILKYPAKYSNVANANIEPALNIDAQSIQALDRKASKPPKCYLDSEADIVDWVLKATNANDREIFQSVSERKGNHSKPKFKSFDCSIMELADDIAYGVHDLEDAIAMGLITREAFRKLVGEDKCAIFIEYLKNTYPNESQINIYEETISNLFGKSKSRKRYISRLVHYFIAHVKIEKIPGFVEPLLHFNAVLPEKEKDFLDSLKTLIQQKVIKSARVQHLEFKGQKMVISVFEAFASDPESFLPEDTYEEYNAAGENTRVICDYVAGMTDAYLLRTYERLFSPRMGSVFDKL